MYTASVLKDTIQLVSVSHQTALFMPRNTGEKMIDRQQENGKEIISNQSGFHSLLTSSKSIKIIILINILNDI